MHHIQRLIYCMGVFFLFTVDSGLAATPPIKSKAVQHFEKGLEDDVGRHWYLVVNPYCQQLSAEKLRVFFHITPDRQIHVTRVTPRKPRDLLTKLTLEALAQSKAPPIPHELLSTPNGLDIKLDFQIYQR